MMDTLLVDSLKRGVYRSAQKNTLYLEGYRVCRVQGKRV